MRCVLAMCLLAGLGACGSGEPLPLAFPFPPNAPEGSSEILVADHGDSFDAFVFPLDARVDVPVTLGESTSIGLEAYVYDFVLDLPVGRIGPEAAHTPARPSFAVQGVARAGTFLGWEPLDLSEGRFSELKVPKTTSCRKYSSGRPVELTFDRDVRFVEALDESRALVGYVNGALILVERPFEVTELGGFDSDKTQGAFQFENQLFLLGSDRVYRARLVGRDVELEHFGPASNTGSRLRWGAALGPDRVATLSENGTVELITDTATAARTLHSFGANADAAVWNCGGLSAIIDSETHATIAAARGDEGSIVTIELGGDEIIEVLATSLGSNREDQVCSVGTTELGLTAGTSAGDLLAYDRDARAWRRVPSVSQNRLLVQAIRPFEDTFVVAAGPFLTTYSRTQGLCEIDQRVTELSVDAFAAWGRDILIAADASGRSHESVVLVSVTR
ncbi:MAG: hypothetical protein HYV07_15585 [Deltaproteobacteria bacterium]|nr:hypothetical protein [Deltaproteobacteria bacterium]